MKLIIKRELLTEKLADINSISERKTTAPILGHVYLEVNETGLTLKGTDTEVSLSIFIPANEIEIIKTGAITVPANKFLDVIKHQKNGSMIQCELISDQFVIRSGESLFKLITLPAEDFPIAEKNVSEKRISIQSKNLQNILNKIKFSMAEQDSRVYLNGLLLDVVDNEALNAVTSDGHRLSCSKSALTKSSEIGTRIILPKKTVAELIKLLGKFEAEVELEIGERQFQLQIGSYKLSSRLIDGNYAQYQSVIPERQAEPILISRSAFLESLQRAKILLTDRHDGVYLKFAEHKMRLLARNTVNEISEENLDVVNNGKREFEICLNINYLMQAVQGLESENVQLHTSQTLTSCLLTGSEDLQTSYVIMAMRI